MNSIQERFIKISKNMKHLAPFACLAESIAGRGYNHKTIRRNFLNLIPSDDYSPEDEKSLVAYLDLLSNRSMDVQNHS
ncbi:MAG: hypothetical protein RLZZ70_151 [Candidatus Parcubacteria bacterium]|jgi:hypothetical protein